MSEIKLNLGCGQIRPKGWINGDSSINAYLQKWSLGKWISQRLGAAKYESSNVVYFNLNKNWTRFKDNSVDVVYSSHCFEHLETESADLYISESYRTLKPGGIIRLVMPDFYAHAKEYIRKIEEGQVDASRDFLWAINMFKKAPGEKSGLPYRILSSIMGHPHRHKYMYDQLLLTQKLADAGFINIQLSGYGHSHYIPSIGDVEGPHLYGGYDHSIYIEAIKPKG